MPRTDRLFQVVQYLHMRRVTTARSLFEVPAVSEGTIYGGVQELMAWGVPVAGNPVLATSVGVGMTCSP